MMDWIGGLIYNVTPPMVAGSSPRAGSGGTGSATAPLSIRASNLAASVKTPASASASTSLTILALKTLSASSTASSRAPSNSGKRPERVVTRPLCHQCLVRRLSWRLARSPVALSRRRQPHQPLGLTLLAPHPPLLLLQHLLNRHPLQLNRAANNPQLGPA